MGPAWPSVAAGAPRAPVQPSSAARAIIAGPFPAPGQPTDGVSPGPQSQNGARPAPAQPSRARVRACVRACARACVRVCVRARACAC
eukprot:13268155-Alexandrium_andersonii.AAC.1